MRRVARRDFINAHARLRGSLERPARDKQYLSAVYALELVIVRIILLRIGFRCFFCLGIFLLDLFDYILVVVDTVIKHP